MSVRTVRVEAGERLVLRLTGEAYNGPEHIKRMAEDLAAARAAADGGGVAGAALLVSEDIEAYVVAAGAGVVVEDGRTRLYVCGPMTGLPEFNYPAFMAAEAELQAAGYATENPATDGQVEGWQWVDYMRRGVTQLMRCDGVAKLDGWENSRGARIEVGLAASLQLPVRPVGEWVEGRCGP